MTRRWDQMRERGSLFWLLLLLFFARLLGRPFGRLILVFVVGYFLVAGGQAYRASRAFLARALGRKPTLGNIYQHFFTFATTVLDRFFLLGDRPHDLQVRVHSPQLVEAQAARGGCIVMVSHLGSFDVMRISGVRTRSLPLRVLLDRAQGPVLTRLLERINPKFAETIIDASERGPLLVLKLREALTAGGTICMMADRVREGERAVPVDFFGGRALLPASPWLLASTLQVPVILAFGLYRGGSRYELHFEMFDERIVAPRNERDAVIAQCAQRYAQRLEHYARSAPYNWFNFYDYWTDDAAARH